MKDTIQAMLEWSTAGGCAGSGCCLEGEDSRASLALISDKKEGKRSYLIYWVFCHAPHASCLKPESTTTEERLQEEEPENVAPLHGDDVSWCPGACGLHYGGMGVGRRRYGCTVTISGC